MTHKTVTIIDAQSDKLPQDVKDLIRKIWTEEDNLRNDVCYVYADRYVMIDEGKYVLECDDHIEYEPLRKYLENEKLDPEKVMLHYWW